MFNQEVSHANQNHRLQSDKIIMKLQIVQKMCRTDFLTKNGEGDLVVMDIETYARREQMLQLREELLAVEEDKIAGRTGSSIDELESYLDDIIERA